MIRMLLSAWVIVLLAIGAAQAAGDPAAGKVKAAGCVGCHGANGQGIPPNPALAGKGEDQPLAAIDGVGGVVAHEAVAGTRHLE